MTSDASRVRCADSPALSRNSPAEKLYQERCRLANLLYGLDAAVSQKVSRMAVHRRSPKSSWCGWSQVNLSRVSAPPEPSGSSMAYLVRAFSRCISNASSISLSISSRKGMPLASHNLGYMLIEVKPGNGVDFVQEEFAAFLFQEEIHARHSGKFQRAERFHRQRLNFLHLRGLQVRGNQQLRAVFQIFRGVIVEFAMRHDFARHGGLWDRDCPAPRLQFRGP